MKASYQYLSNENKFSMWSQCNLHFIRFIFIFVLTFSFRFLIFGTVINIYWFSACEYNTLVVGRIILFIHNR